MVFTAAIVGRPNVGKSTLFNRLVGRRAAIVDPTPGVTRDRREGEARLAELRFRVIDTAGLEDAAADTLEAAMRAQTERALADADVALFVVDARAGTHAARPPFRRLAAPPPCAGDPGRQQVARDARARPACSKPTRSGWASRSRSRPSMARAWPSSSTRSMPPGRRKSRMPPPRRRRKTSGPLQLAILGRPNVGKSTLVNRLIGEPSGC